MRALSKLNYITNKTRNVVLFPLLVFLQFLNDLIANYYIFRTQKMYEDNGMPELKIFNFHFEYPLFTPGYYLISPSDGHLMNFQSALGMLWILMVAVLVAFASAQLIQKSVNKESDKFGPYKWRIIFVICGWMFVPVPASLCLGKLFLYCC